MLYLLGRPLQLTNELTRQQSNIVSIEARGTGKSECSYWHLNPWNAHRSADVWGRSSNPYCILFMAFGDS